MQNVSTVFVNNNAVDASMFYDNIPNTCQEVTSSIIARDLVIRTDLSAPQTQVTVQWLVLNWDCSKTDKYRYMMYHNKGPMTSVNPFAGRFNMCKFHTQYSHLEAIGESECIFHCVCPDGCSNILLRIRSPLVGARLCEVHVSAGLYP